MARTRAHCVPVENADVAVWRQHKANIHRGHLCVILADAWDSKPTDNCKGSDVGPVDTACPSSQSHNQQHLKSIGAQKPGRPGPSCWHFGRSGSVHSASAVHVVEHKHACAGPPIGQQPQLKPPVHAPEVMPPHAGTTPPSTLVAGRQRPLLALMT